MQNLTSENVKIRTEINIKKARYLECHWNVEFFRFSWEYLFLRKIFSSDRSACNKILEYDRNQHSRLRLQNFVSILSYKNYLSFILKKDRRLIPTPLIPENTKKSNGQQSWMPMKSRIFSSLSAHKNFLGNIFFLEKLFVLDQLVKRYNQHPCLRLNNFVSILTYKNYLSFILKKDKQKVYSNSSNFTGSLARF